ncbi:hypothetical protein BH11MYX2_BH11MYX2_08630 [soil metagenome]
MKIAMVQAAIALAVLALFAPRADAYPQYQLSRDTTCTGCHVSPAGGGALNENGIAVAETTAWRGGDGSFMYGMSTPSWLKLDGDARGAAGFVDPGVASAAAYPMQAEVGATAGGKGFSVRLLGGLRSPQVGGSIAQVFWSRAHSVMWQQNPDSAEGLYVRAGRFMPTYGLRLAEHVVYTQRFGGDPLYFEAYGANVSYISHAFEVHATGFVHDSIASAAEHGDGGALYAEARIGDHAAVGVEGKHSISDDTTMSYGGVTGKVYLPGPDLLFQAEGEVIRKDITVGAGDIAIQLAGYLMATHNLDHGLMLDVGVGHFTQDTRVKGLYRDAFDVNLHWFMTSHVEWLLTTRVELLDAAGGPNGGYALAQIHYRL